MSQPTSERVPLDTTVVVETPEHIRFHYRLAGPSLRALAYLVDLLVRGVFVTIIAFVAAIAGVAVQDAFTEASAGVVLLVVFVVEWGYYLLWETLWSGRSPGKRAVRIRVVTQGGHPLRFMDSLLRNLLRAADLLPNLYALGLVVMGNDSRFRRLGDLVAGTMVVVEERQTVAAPLRLAPLPTQEELGSLPQHLPLTGDELDAIELFLRRVGRLSPAREHELAEMVAPVYAKRLGIRVRDPVRFLTMLYCRANQGKSR